MRASRLPALIPSTIDARTCSGVPRPFAVRSRTGTISSMCAVMMSPPRAFRRQHRGSVATRATVTGGPSGVAVLTELERVTAFADEEQVSVLDFGSAAARRRKAGASGAVSPLLDAIQLRRGADEQASIRDRRRRERE